MRTGSVGARTAIATLPENKGYAIKRPCRLCCQQSNQPLVSMEASLTNILK
jgi:hypothetical protein